MNDKVPVIARYLGTEVEIKKFYWVLIQGHLRQSPVQVTFQGGNPVSVHPAGSMLAMSVAAVAEWGDEIEGSTSSNRARLDYKTAPNANSVDTLEAAKAQLTSQQSEGLNCPCCGGFYKVYERKMYGSLISALVQIATEYKRINDWVDIRKISLRGGEYAKLLYWDLIERRVNEDSVKRFSGLWRPTVKGLLFIEGKLSVEAYALVLQNKVIGYSDKKVSVHDALGKRFDYTELMWSYNKLP